jgi:hypothetical protein
MTAALVVAGCDCGPSRHKDDAGIDSNEEEPALDAGAGVLDAGAGLDAGSEVDAGLADADEVDGGLASEQDAGPADASLEDADEVDASLADADANLTLEDDGGPADAAVDDAGQPDGGELADAGGEDAGDPCVVGTATSYATATSLSLFGEVVYYADGGALPPGRYSVKYVDGCMKYGGNQDWTIHAYQDGHYGWWLVDAKANKVTMPPGTVGYSTSTGAFAYFDDCVSENLKLPAKEFDFDGGVLGVYLQDSPVEDNVAGEHGRNPKWELKYLSGCDAGSSAP